MCNWFQHPVCTNMHEHTYHPDTYTHSGLWLQGVVNLWRHCEAEAFWGSDEWLSLCECGEWMRVCLCALCSSVFMLCMSVCTCMKVHLHPPPHCCGCEPCPVTSLLIFVCDTVQLNVSHVKCHTPMDWTISLCNSLPCVLKHDCMATITVLLLYTTCIPLLCSTNCGKYWLIALNVKAATIS